MTMSSDQATQAAVFLTIYKDAVNTLEEAAFRDNSNDVIENFTERIIKISGTQMFKRLCDPKNSVNFEKKDPRLRQIERDVRAFQFSHYVFLKYMPNFLTFTGDSQELIQYMKDQNYILDRDIRS